MFGSIVTKLKLRRGSGPDEIGSVGDRLKVDASVTTQSSCPVLPNTFKIEFSDTDISMISSYSTIYSYNGTGVFHGGSFDFNSDSVRVKLEVDGNLVFALTLDEVECMQSFNDNGCNTSHSDNNTHFISKTAGNILNIYFDCPIKYDTSILITGQRTGSSDKLLKKQIVYLSKDS